MAMDSIRALHAEPAVADPPPPGRRDAVLVGVVVVGALVEVLLRRDLVWWPVALMLALVVAPTLYWRRVHPLAMLVVAFTATNVVTLATVVAAVDPVGLYTTAALLVLPYALTRWASGRDVFRGAAVVAATYVIGVSADWTTIGEAIGGFVVVLLPLVLGSAVRARRQSRERAIETARFRERDELARELHDTVAHHVSAIVVQAQAGRAVASTRPEIAVQTLEVIEESAARTLEELRSMVGALRRDDDAPLAPASGIADLERLAHAATPDGAGIEVEVRRSGDLTDLSPAVEAAVFRIAQESVTNARRHARDATRATIQVVGTDTIDVTIVDDGGPGPSATDGGGYGLVGMRERAELLGGSLTAGRDRNGGWRVVAQLPRREPRT